MTDTANSINAKARILVSRNAPIALVVGVGGFLGSNLADKLLEKNIQVIGVDDLEISSKKNLEDAVKNKNFHLVNESVINPNFRESELFLNLPRLDYAFFLSESGDADKFFSEGLNNFLKFIKDLRDDLTEKTAHIHQKDSKPEEHKASGKPRIAFISSIKLYDSNLEHKERLLKQGEVHFAKFVKYYKLNGRIIRLATVYGPRMDFVEEDPIVRLIQATLSDELNEQQSSLDFSTRNLFVDDAVHLIIKSVLSGATANKIYDGALIEPIKVSEIKQILLDPVWHEEKRFSPSELPPWYTPNLKKTTRELNWKPVSNIITSLKKTLAYFRENEIDIPNVEKSSYKDVKGWSFKDYEKEGSKKEEEIVDAGNNEELRNGNRDSKEDVKRGRGVGRKFGFLIVFLIIFFGLIYPAASLVIGGFTIKNHLKQSKIDLENGEFDKAQIQIKGAQSTLTGTKELIYSIGILKRIGFLADHITSAEQLADTLSEGINGVEHAALGSKALFQTTRIISGEEPGDPKEFYNSAQTELTIASQKIDKVKARLSEINSSSNFPDFIKSRIGDLELRLNVYADLVEKARVAAYLMPEVTAVNGKKSYLVLLENNLELRPTGGFIGSYGKFDFENGRLKGIKVDDIYNLDGGLKDAIDPPIELKTDLGINRWYLRDSNFDPDFPTSARQAEFFFKKESGEAVNGVIALDLAASGKLLTAVGGLDLPEYGERVDGVNLFERSITHAEVGFFPGSQAKKSYLVSLQTQLFNKVFYLPKQNWPAIIQALAESLEQKHMLIYLEDPAIFSYLASANWSGVFPRAPELRAGDTGDFLSVVEANLGANKSNYFLTRRYKLNTSFGKEGQINHKLKIDYKNTSPSEVFPAGKYKNRMRIYLPLGTKISKALWGETDITAQLVTFSDYGRTGYSVLLELMPKEQKSLMIDYNLQAPLNFKDNYVSYRLDILKQPGTGADPFDFTLTYPINFSIESNPEKSVTSEQEVNIGTELLTDRSFLFKIKKK